MNISDIYFDFLIGSITLDFYQPKASGIILTVDTTQGYHRKTVHLSTRYPRMIESKIRNIFTLFPITVWISICVSLCALTIAIMLAVIIYSNVNSSLVKKNILAYQVSIRLFAGITEPDNENWFSTFSTGNYVNYYSADWI